MINLHPDWKKLLTKAWSVRLFALAAAFSGVEALVPYLPAFLSLGPGVMAILTTLTCVAGIFVRLIAQKAIMGGDKNAD